MAKTINEAKTKEAAKKNPRKTIPPEDAHFDRKFMDEPGEAVNTAGTKKEKAVGPVAGLTSYNPAKDKYPQIEIIKGKLLKGDRIKIIFLRKNTPDSEPVEVDEKHKEPPRKQFREAFAKLAVHAALSAEYISITSINDISKVDPEIIKNFNVTGFTVIGSGSDDEGVIVTAHKKVKSGRVVGFNTETIRFNDESDNAYAYLDELSDSIDLCKSEIQLYLSGNHAEDPQTKLDLK